MRPVNSSLPVEQFLLEARTIPVLDVRTPAEFARGHMPGAVNLPLFDDEQRVQVGKIYKQSGRQAAILHGLELVGPALAGLVRQAEQVAAGNRLLVHCWRGGMRSGSLAWLLSLYGLRVQTLHKGYKAYRAQVLEQLQNRLPVFKVLGGKTGSGKTRVLQLLAKAGEQVIDLEKLASHKGSAFGALGEPDQPSQEQFENNLAAAFDQIDRGRPVWIEDESRTIGRIGLPPALWQAKMAATVYVLEVSQEQRLAHLMQDYGQMPMAELAASLQKIEKRLGGLATRQALQALQENRLPEACAIVLNYYDSAYLHSLARRPAEKIVYIRADLADQEQLLASLLNASG